MVLIPSLNRQSSSFEIVLNSRRHKVIFELEMNDSILNRSKLSLNKCITRINIKPNAIVLIYLLIPT
jgi:hypothetical protein